MQKILIVDDNIDMLDTLEHLFSFYQFQVVKAENGKIAIDMALNEQPDIILLDAYMPVMDGFAACQILKKKRKTQNIPIVFLTAKYIDPKDRESGLQLGADDYLVKPFNSKELVSRIKTVLKKTHMIRNLRKENEDLSKIHNRLSRELEESQKSESELAENLAIDHLTGLYSKKYFLARLKEEYHRALRYENSVSLSLIDVDAFGRINDMLGYQIGDFILLKIANVILMNTRISDIVARLDGAYFAVILPQTDAQGGYFEAERLRVALNQTKYLEDFMVEMKSPKQRRKFEQPEITVSIGVATWPASEEIGNERELLKLAKKALDKAKTGGKNKTFTFERLD